MWGEQPDKTALLKDFMGVMESYLVLMRDPEQLKKTISDALEVSDKQKARAASAQEYIAEHAQLSANMAAKEKQVNETLTRAEEMLKTQQVLAADNQATSQRLKTQQTQHERKDKEHSDKDAAQTKRQEELEKKEANIVAREQTLKTEQKRVSEYEAKLKQRADLLRAGTEGL